MCSVPKCDFAGLGIHGLDDGQRIHIVAFSAQRVTAALEALLHGDANALDRGTGCFAQIDQTAQRLAVGQKIVNKQHMVAGVRYFLATITGNSFCLVKE